MPPKPRPHGKRRPTNEGGDRRLVAIGAAGVLVAVGLVGLFLLRGGDEAVAADTVREAMTAAGCTLRAVDALPANQHTVEPGETSDEWNTDPPTSGPHFGQTAIYGAYTEPLDQARLVHNLEHGAIFIQYGEDVPDETLARLQEFYDRRQPGTLLAPYPSLGDEIALGAWTVGAGESTAYLAKCTEFDEAAFSAFFDELQFRGPERFPRDSMLPGNG
jgi:hypothetical protein